jgi:predicted ATP-grasp superfamily ATP-dependent carboligase
MEAVRQLVGTSTPPVLIPLDDVATLYVDDAPSIAEHCLVPRPRHGLLRQLADKRQLAALLSHLGIPAPRSRLVSSRDQLADAAAEIGLPAVLKSADPHVLRTTRGAKSVTVAPTMDSLMRSYQQMDGPAQGSVLLQEYIGGENAADWIFNGCFDRHSVSLFHGTGVKLRQWPLETGAATLGRCAPNSVLEDLSLRMTSAVGYTGMIDIDYRFDERDGLYKLLDVNPRIGSSFRLFVDENGMDIPRVHYLDLTGQPVSVQRAIAGRKWMVESRDFQSGLRLLGHGRLTVREWLRSLSGVEEVAWFDSRDVRPFAAMLSHYAGRIARRSDGRQ